MWIKIHCEKWLLGSTRWELTYKERCFWIDLLALAAMDSNPGYVTFSSVRELAGKLQYRANFVKKVLQKFIQTEKIRIENFQNLQISDGKSDGKCKTTTQREQNSIQNFHICVLNWNNYQSEYLRQKPYRSKEKEAIKQEKKCNKVTNENVTSLRLDKTRGDKKRLEKKVLKKVLKKVIGPEQEKNAPTDSALNILTATEKDFCEDIRASPFFGTIKDPVGFAKAEIRAFPEVDFGREIAKAEAWLVANPLRKKKNYRRFLNAWFSRAQPKTGRKILGGEDV